MDQLYVVGISAFFIGLVLGLVLGVWYAKKYKDKMSNFQKSTISLVVFSLWSASMGVDVYNGTNNTPLFLHLFMGAVIGTINHEFGEWLLKFIERK